MLTLEAVESAIKDALKARDQIAADTLRALKTRIQNEQISKGSALDDGELLALVKSENKRRKEAEAAFRGAGRTEAADKEAAEMKVLSVFLPVQVDESEINAIIEQKQAEHNWTAKDFGTAMAAMKSHFGNSADGGTIAKLLKQKLNG